jgi:mevalonate kinase
VTEGVTATGTGTGHGKLLLCGEHAVVYGHPAIAFAVDRRTRVTLSRREGPTVVASPHADERLTEAIHQVLSGGYTVEVDTDLPVGRGMGSSAALAVALVRAEAALAGDTLDADAVYERAMPLERAFHGNPSGVDVAVSARGGCLWFRRGEPPVREALTPGAWSIAVIDSGTAGDTSELVAQVAARRPAIDPALEQIGALVTEARHQLHDPRALGALLTRNHELLRQIGVSTPVLDGLVQLALDAGAYGAKLAGAGGGGVVLALTEGSAHPIVDRARAAGFTAFECAPWLP